MLRPSGPMSTCTRGRVQPDNTQKKAERTRGRAAAAHQRGHVEARQAETLKGAAEARHLLFVLHDPARAGRECRDVAGSSMRTGAGLRCNSGQDMWCKAAQRNVHARMSLVMQSRGPQVPQQRSSPQGTGRHAARTTTLGAHACQAGMPPASISAKMSAVSGSCFSSSTLPCSRPRRYVATH